MSIESDRSDWYAFKAEIGLTDALEASAPNHIEIPAGEWQSNFYLAPSKISGEGTFAARSFPAGHVIGPAWIEGKRTELGCKGNHSQTPTAKMTFSQGNVWLVTIREVAKDEELTTSYRETWATRKALGLLSW